MVKFHPESEGGMNRHVYCFGDSITYGEWDEQGGWVQRLRSYSDQAFISHRGGKTLTYNLGVPGDTAADLLLRMDAELEARFDGEAETLVVIAAGMNDAHFITAEQKYAFTPEVFEGNLGKLVGIARKYTKKIALVGLNPVDQNKVDPLPWNPAKAYHSDRVKLFNAVIEKIAGEENLFFADIWKSWVQLDYRALLSDGLHPNASGHRRIAERIAAFLATAAGAKAGNG
jgi:lysophospholipase L1-like esterase